MSLTANVDSNVVHNPVPNESYEMLRLRSPITSRFQRRRGEVLRRNRLLAGALALLVSTGFAVRAAPFLHAQVLVFVPAYEGSQLIDPDLDKGQNDPPCVWGSLAVLLSSRLYFGLRMPNPLVAKPMLAVGPIDIYRKFVDTMTEAHADAPRFSPYTQGSDFFLFAYDWRQEIASVSAPLLGEALENYARIHERKTGIPAGQTKFTIVTHSMGGYSCERCSAKSLNGLPAFHVFTWLVVPTRAV
jgi:hypothetical protein